MPTIEVYLPATQEAKAKLVDALIESRAQLLESSEAGGKISIVVKVGGSQIDSFVRRAGVNWSPALGG